MDRELEVTPATAGAGGSFLVLIVSGLQSDAQKAAEIARLEALGWTVSSEPCRCYGSVRLTRRPADGE